jgi:large subunit ribosomal protein L31e
MSKDEDNLTRIYNINLGKCWDTPKYRRTDRVINMIKEFAVRNMDSQRIKIDQDLNRFIWARGKTNPPRKVRVRMIKDDDDTVIVSSYTDSKQIPTVEKNETEGKE